jgi:hypothetical protein
LLTYKLFSNLIQKNLSKYITLWKKQEAISLSQAYELLKLIAISGELPAAAVKRLHIKNNYRYKMLSDLKKRKLIRVYQRDGIKAYRLTQLAKRSLLKDNPQFYKYFLIQNTQRNYYTEKTRRLRLHAASQAYITLLHAGINLYGKHNEIGFYFSYEMKSGIEKNKIRSSRTVGMLDMGNLLFIVYNTGRTLMKWEGQAELRLKSLLEMQFYYQREICILLLGDNLEIALQLLNGKQQHKTALKLHAVAAPVFYCLNTTDGENQIRMMLSKEWQQYKSQALRNFLPKTESSNIEHDAWDDSGHPVLFACDCNLTRIKRYYSALSLLQMQGHVICFDWQEPLLKSYMGNLLYICERP